MLLLWVSPTWTLQADMRWRETSVCFARLVCSHYCGRYPDIRSRRVAYGTTTASQRDVRDHDCMDEPLHAWKPRDNLDEMTETQHSTLHV